MANPPGRSRLAAAAHLTPFVLLFAYLLVQYRYVYLYMDDYGYASLSYGFFQPDVEGTHFTIGQLLDYQLEHYRLVNGRNFIVHLLLLPHLWLTRVVMAGAIPVIYYLLLRVMRAPSFASAALMCLSYSLFPLHAYRNGFYWYSAGLTYVLPLIALYGAVYLLMILDRGGRRPRVLVAVVAALLFGVATFHEQLGVTVLAFTGLLAVREAVVHRRLTARDIVLVASAAAGTAVVVLAPGTLDRREDVEHLSPLALGWTNAIRLGSVLFTPSIAFAAALAATVAVIGFANWKARRWPRTVAVAAGCAAAGMVLVVGFASGPVHAIYPPVFAIAAVVAIVHYLCATGRVHAGFLLTAAVATLAALLFLSPYVVERMVIVPEMLIFAAGATAIGDLRVRAPVKATTVLVVGVYAVGVLTASTRGYMANRYTIEEWDARLTETSRALEGIPHEEVSGTMTLPAYPEANYAGDMPDFIRYYLREYYRIPQEYEIAFTPPNPLSP
ncbi:MAG: DUF6056 family protein [Bifidobacteriaceae bacterium]|jgi:hypothetical protein|nr:DUF6056 family protein [Bifidobacteriaceae bacterium]